MTFYSVKTLKNAPILIALEKLKSRHFYYANILKGRPFLITLRNISKKWTF